MKMHRKEIVDANIIRVEVGTTGFCGGDTGHGCRTCIRVEDRGGTAMRVTGLDTRNGFEINLGGDSELRTFIKACEFIVETLKKEIEGKEIEEGEQKRKTSRRMELNERLFGGLCEMCLERKATICKTICVRDGTKPRPWIFDLAALCQECHKDVHPEYKEEGKS